ncbi:MAG: hypothetical protein NTY19_06715 [Planctomycetota bacterium]|nr:hypothetical protein [Planctomycetota bacterium]
MVSADEIPGRAADDSQEIMGDITTLLRQRSTPDIDLVDLFNSILAGTGTRSQRARYGHSNADTGRKKIVQVIQQYAQQTNNWSLMRLVSRFQDFDGTRPEANRRPAPKPKPAKPTYPPDEQDYRSIVELLQRSGRQGSMALFGRARRRWLERAPRDPNSPHPNRLADVLARMVQDGVLGKRGTKYIPGPQYAKYLTQEPAAVA